MSPDRDDLWADMAQFDTRLADGVWDGEVHDPDAPAWYAELVALIRRARGPAEAQELADEPRVVATMRRTALRRRGGRAPRRRVRSAARVVAMKATAAIATTSMAGVAAAAATGAVATVAVTMAVPAINRHVVPMILDPGRPPAVSPAPSAPQRSGARGCDDEHGHEHCTLDAGSHLAGTAHPAGAPDDAAPPPTEPAPDAPPSSRGATAATPTTGLDPAPVPAAAPTTGASPPPPAATAAVPAGGTTTTTTAAGGTTTATTAAGGTTTTAPASRDTGTGTGTGTGGTGDGHATTATGVPEELSHLANVATGDGTAWTRTTPGRPGRTATARDDAGRTAGTDPTIEPLHDGAGAATDGRRTAGPDRDRPGAPARPASAEAAGSSGPAGPPTAAAQRGPRR